MVSVCLYRVEAKQRINSVELVQSVQLQNALILNDSFSDARLNNLRRRCSNRDR